MTAALEAFSRHGGRIALARRSYPHAPQPWLDLSTGINPCPYPARPATPAERGRLPDPEALLALEAAAAAAFGAPPTHVVAVPGSEAAIRLLPQVLAVGRVAIAPDTYGGHSEAWRASGAEVISDDPAAPVAVVVSPNNPDGRIAARETLLASAQRRWTIVDEAFADAAPEASVAAEADGRLIVLRSFGKFFGLAGLRLGFVVAAPDLVARIRARLGDWPLSADAIAAGLQAYADADWIAATRQRLARDAARLDGVLTRAGLRAAGGAALFRLVETTDAAAVFDRLAHAGVLCRPFPGACRLRFGLPAGSAGFDRLARALAGAVA